MGELSFSERLAAHKAKLAAEQEAREQIEFDDDLIPAIESDSKPRTELDEQIDRAIGNLGILEAYRRYIGKEPIPNPGSRREGIHIRCPFPGHEDKRPSAWVNLDENVGYCAKCAEGFDEYDLGAIHYGYAVPRSYKTDGSFPELRRRMAEDLGFVIKRNTMGEYMEAPPEPAPPSDDPEDDQGGGAIVTPPPAPAPAPSGAVAPVAPAQQDDDDVPMEMPSIEWRDIVEPGTFLWDWMEATSIDDLPEEFYFWLGLIAIGFTAGNRVTLADSPNVRANLFVCLYGPSGIGKSRSSSVLERLLREALPYDPNDDLCTGTKIVPKAGSAESLVDAFCKMETDLSTGIASPLPVRGFVRFDELSDLMGRASRVGNVIKPTLMDFFDGYKQIEIVSRGAGTVVAKDHFASAVTTTQPGAIRELLTRGDADSGFVNRWIFAAGKPKPLVSIGRDPVDVAPLVQPLANLKTWCNGQQQVEVTNHAYRMFDEFFELEINPLRTRSSTSPLLTRIDLQLKKIILLLAINSKTNRPGTDIVHSALSLFPYLMQTYGMLGDRIGMGVTDEVADEIGRFIVARTNQGRPPNTRDIAVQLGRTFPRGEITKALKVMEETGEIERIGRGPHSPFTFNGERP